MRLENQIVQAVNEDTAKNRYGIKIGTNWYNAKGPAPCKKGDKVSFDYTDNPVGDRVFHNIDGIVEIKIGTPTPQKIANTSDPNAFFGMCCNQAMLRQQHNVDLNEEKYKNAVRTLFKWNTELKLELLK